MYVIRKRIKLSPKKSAHILVYLQTFPTNRDKPGQNDRGQNESGRIVGYTRILHEGGMFRGCLEDLEKSGDKLIYVQNFLGIT
jgi:hypothetical protein